MKVLSIGRGEDCNIIISDMMVSRRHAILKIYPMGKMEIVDMGQNGTFVNGVKLTPNVAYPVSRKDVVSFAHVRQLDWSQVPGDMKYYRYGLFGLVIVIAISGVIGFVYSLTGDSSYPLEEPPAAKVAPTDTIGKKKEEKKEVNSKKEKMPTSADFFPKKKEKKDDKDKKKEEAKNDTVKRKKPEHKEDNPALM